MNFDLIWPFRSVLKSVKRTNVAALRKYLSQDQIKETDAAKDFYSYDESPHPINLWVNLKVNLWVIWPWPWVWLDLELLQYPKIMTSLSKPAVITIPKTTEDVVNIVKWCNEYNHSIIGYGTGQGFSDFRVTNLVVRQSNCGQTKKPWYRFRFGRWRDSAKW